MHLVFFSILCLLYKVHPIITWSSPENLPMKPSAWFGPPKQLQPPRVCLVPFSSPFYKPLCRRQLLKALLLVSEKLLLAFRPWQADSDSPGEGTWWECLPSLHRQKVTLSLKFLSILHWPRHLDPELVSNCAHLFGQNPRKSVFSFIFWWLLVEYSLRVVINSVSGSQSILKRKMLTHR